MSKNKQNSIRKVLDSFSTNEITGIFNDIDNKVGHLIQCSGNDFLKLNNHFKNFFNEVNEISGKSSEIFEEITNTQQFGHIQTLNELAVSLRDILHSIDYQVQKCYAILKNITKNTNLSNLHVKNFKQNLKTLKFVVTNLKIVSITSESNKNIQEINKLLDAIDRIYPCFDQKFLSSYKLFNNSVQTLWSLKEKTENALNNIEQLVITIKNIEQKLNDATALIPALKENTNKCSDALSKIITNLQYQDIVKQKIDHVSAIHKKVTSQLTKIADEGKNNDQFLLNKAKLYIQISDLSGLQAAQLMHANKEYQHALSNITNQFIEISDLIESIASLSHTFFDKNETHDKENISTLIDNLQVHQEIGKELNLINNLFELQIESLILRSDTFLECFDQVSEFQQALNQFIENINKHSAKSGAQRLSHKTIAQVQTISTDLDNIADSLNNIKSDNVQLMQFLKKEFHGNYLKQSHENGINQSIQEVNIVSLKITTSFKKAYETLVKSLSSSSEVSRKIKKAIDDVEYYEIFEKEIESIIEILNEVNKKLKIEDADALREIQTVESAREHYTMSSEHDIHQQYTQTSEEADNIFEDDLLAGIKKSDTQEDDNLELF